MNCRRTCGIVLLLIVSLLPACRGGRVTGFEYATDDGQWRIDGTLIRSYNVTVTQAYEAIQKLAASKRWIVTDSRSGRHTATVDARTAERVHIHFDVWAPPNKATEIGIEYAGGDKIGSIHVFEDLERLLPGKRITVNKPE